MGTKHDSLPIADDHVDNLTHLLLDYMASIGIKLDSDLASDLNDVLTDFITDKCGFDIS